MRDRSGTVIDRQTVKGAIVFKLKSMALIDIGRLIEASPDRKPVRRPSYSRYSHSNRLNLEKTDINNQKINNTGQYWWQSKLSTCCEAHSHFRNSHADRLSQQESRSHQWNSIISSFTIGLPIEIFQLSSSSFGSPRRSSTGLMVKFCTVSSSRHHLPNKFWCSKWGGHYWKWRTGGRTFKLLWSKSWGLNGYEVFSNQSW